LPNQDLARVGARAQTAVPPTAFDWAMFRFGDATPRPACRRQRRMRREGQLRLPLAEVARWGGKRAGAGRKLVAARASPPHRPRAPHRSRWPVHVTLRAREALPSLRSARVFPFLQRSLAACHKAAFRVVHFSVQTDHVHLVVEGDEANALVRGLQGLAVRCAKAVNRAVRRRGGVWSTRYHSRALRTPTEARRGLVYVLLNFRKHLRARPAIDPRSSGPWFGGWRQSGQGAVDRSVDGTRSDPRGGSPVAASRTWLATVGWRRAGGPIGLDERPALGLAQRRTRRQPPG
jgi:REP-associated tyrosine transposase